MVRSRFYDGSSEFSNRKLNFSGSHSDNLNRNSNQEDVEEESIGHTLMNDIQNFLERKGAIVTATNGEDKKGGDSSDDEEEDEDDTLQDDELGHCLPKDDDHNSGCALYWRSATLCQLPTLMSVIHSSEEKRRRCGSAVSAVATAIEGIFRRRGYQRIPHLIWDGQYSDFLLRSVVT